MTSNVGSNKINRITFEELAGFGTAMPTDGSGTRYHIPVDDVPQPDLVQLYGSAQVANARGARTKEYPTQKEFGYAFNCRLWTGTASAPTSFFLQKLVESYFGGAVTVCAATTVGVANAGAGRTADLKVTSSADYATALAAGVNPAIVWGGEMRFVTAVADGTHVTTNADFSSVPTAGDTIYKTFTVAAIKGERTAYEVITVEKDGHIWQGGPGQIMSYKWSGLAAGGEMKMEMAFKGDVWMEGFAPSVFTKNTFTGSPLVSKGGQFIVDTSLVCLADGSIDFGVEKEWQKCATNTNNNGRDGIVVVGPGNPSFTIKELGYNSARWDKFRDGSDVPVQISFGAGTTTASRAKGLYGAFMGCAQMKVKEDPDGNQLAMGITFEGKDTPDATLAAIAAGGTQPLSVGFCGGV